MNCPISSYTTSTVTQSLLTRIVNQVLQSDSEKLLDHISESSQTDLYLNLILMSLKHVHLSSASTPRNNKNSWTPLHAFDQPFEAIADIPTNPLYNFNNSDISKYSSFELVSKSGVLKTLYIVQETYPYVEVFYDVLSHCVVLVAHTGYCGLRGYSYSIRAHCHSNIGFYNYLKYMDETQHERHSDEISCAQIHEQSDNSFLQKGCSSDHSHNIMPQLYGYDVRDIVLHLQSCFSTFFTSDGIQIHVEKQGFAESSTSISVSLLTTEGHKISLVKSVPGPSKLSTDSLKNDLQTIKGLNDMFMWAFFNNGLKIATCCSKPNRNDTNISNDHHSTSSSSPPSRPESVKEHTAMSHVESSSMQEPGKENDRTLAHPNTYQHIYATTSLGLNIHVYSTLPSQSEMSSNASGRVFIKQQYYKSTKMPCNKVAEVCRYYLQEGLLIYFMSDGSIIIHCADGSIYRTATKHECDQYQNHEPTHSLQAKDFQFQSQLRSISDIFGVKSKQIWLLTLADGRCFLWKQIGTCKRDEKDGLIQAIPIETVPCSATTDPITKQVSYSSLHVLTILFKIRDAKL